MTYLNTLIHSKSIFYKLNIINYILLNITHNAIFFATLKRRAEGLFRSAVVVVVDKIEKFYQQQLHSDRFSSCPAVCRNYIFLMISSANSEHFNLVAPSIKRSKS